MINPVRYLKHRTTIATKIFMFTCGMLLAWSLLFYFGAYRRSLNIVQQNVQDSMLRYLDTVYREQNSYFDEMDKVSNLLFANENFQRLLLSGISTPSYIEHLKIYHDIRDVLDSFTSNFPYYEIRLYFDQSTLFTAEGRTTFLDDTVKDTEWYQRVIAADGAIVWGTEFKKWSASYQEQEAIAQFRVIKDTDLTWERICILSISLSKEILQNSVNDAAFSEYAQCILLDEYGNIIVSSPSISGQEQNLIAQIHDSSLSSASSVLEIDTDSGRMLTFFRKNERNSWTTALAIPYSYVAAEVRQMLINAAILFVASFIIIISMAYAYSRSVARRISNISSLIDKLENQNFSHDIPIRYQDELAIVEKRINRLIIRIHDLLLEVKHKERSKRKAELMALQSQINPHFLYNTLDSINWMAVHAGQNDIAQSVSLLGRFLRIGLSGRQDMINLSDELEHVRCYIAIQQIRFAGKLDVIYEVDQEALSCETPKIILQPFVENAIIHGFASAGRSMGRLFIQAKIDQGRIFVLIKDDGAGFDQFASQETSSLALKMKNHSYGISNVRERMNLIYGNAAKISLISTVGQGTEVTLSWPAILNNHDKTHDSSAS